MTASTLKLVFGAAYNSDQQFILFVTLTGLFRDGQLENLWGGGGGGEVQKKNIRARENYMKKKIMHAN